MCPRNVGEIEMNSSEILKVLKVLVERNESVHVYVKQARVVHGGVNDHVHRQSRE